MLNRSVLLLLVAYGGWITSYAPFATRELGWTTLDVGIIFSVFGIGDVTLGPWVSHLADRTGRRRVAVLAAIPISLFGVVLVLGLPRAVLYAVSFVTGASLTAFNASWFAMLTAAVPARRRGRVFGFVSAIGSIGTVAGRARGLGDLADDRSRLRTGHGERDGAPCWARPARVASGRGRGLGARGRRRVGLSRSLTRAASPAGRSRGASGSRAWR